MNDSETTLYIVGNFIGKMAFSDGTSTIGNDPQSTQLNAFVICYGTDGNILDKKRIFTSKGGVNIKQIASSKKGVHFMSREPTTVATKYGGSKKLYFEEDLNTEIYSVVLDAFNSGINEKNEGVDLSENMRNKRPNIFLETVK